MSLKEKRTKPGLRNEEDDGVMTDVTPNLKEASLIAICDFQGGRENHLAL